MIAVTLVAAETYRVEVDSVQGAFQVTMEHGDYLSLSAGRCTQEWVLVQTFQFLLEHGPIDRWPRRFDLIDVVERHPTFIAEMSRRLADR